MQKEKIVLFGVEIQIPLQQKLFLIRLLFEEGCWLTAGDLALVYRDWDDSQKSRQAMSAAVTKMDDALAKQLNIAYRKGIDNKLERPV